MPPDTERFDFELEIAAIVCQDVRNATPAQAREAIGGYCVMNDWSARDIQGREMKLKLGPSKGKDFATTIGPWVVTADELDGYRDADGFLDLEMTVSVNGEQVGADRSGHMGWSFEQLVSHASRASWVKAGEVLASGTCASGSLAESWGRTGSLTPPPLQAGRRRRDDASSTSARSGTGSSRRATPRRGPGRPAAGARVRLMPTITTFDPATGHELATYDAHDEAAVAAALAGAHAAYVGWSARPLGERTDLLRAVGKLLTERREEYAALMTAEMGKPLAEALAEVDKCAWNCEVVADSAPGWLADHEVASGAARSWLSYEPLGVVFAVMPWNYPFWQVLRFASAALVAGNAGVLKHSPERDRLRAGDRAGCSRTRVRPPACSPPLVLADEQLAEMTPRIIGDPAVAAVTLTGSERAGEAVGVGRRAVPQEERARAGRVRPVRGARRRRPRGRRGRRREVPLRQRRPVLHRGQAVHRGGVGGRRVRGAADRSRRCSRARADGARRPARPAARPGRWPRSPRAPPSSPVARCRTARAGSTRRRCSTT